MPGSVNAIVSTKTFWNATKYAAVSQQNMS